MKTIVFLATLVAVLTFNGCYALTGCPGSAQCDPNWVADAADGGNVDGGSISSKNDGSVTETTTVETKPSVNIVMCKDYMYLDFKVWYCEYPHDPSIKANTGECTIEIVVDEEGCWVTCPYSWSALVNDITFLSSDEMVIPMFPNKDKPLHCHKVK